jgi:hypothetical protein
MSHNAAYNSFSDCTSRVSIVSHARTWVPCRSLGLPHPHRVFYVLALFRMSLVGLPG